MRFFYHMEFYVLPGVGGLNIFDFQERVEGVAGSE
jgi:hypothetical protein